jgi:ABC-type multidrug transport system ATPase subunit
MKQRFGVVAALLHRPQIVLLDEPTSSLDPIERQRIFSLLRDYSPTALIVLSSHNVSELAGFVENVIIISGGEIQYAGSVKDLRSRYEGKIWESEQAIEGAMLLGELYNGNAHVKHYFSEQLLSGGTPIMPSLEDCALHILGGQK